MDHDFSDIPTVEVGLTSIFPRVLPWRLVGVGLLGRLTAIFPRSLPWRLVGRAAQLEHPIFPMTLALEVGCCHPYTPDPS